jgi:hypothetical protein
MNTRARFTLNLLILALLAVPVAAQEQDAPKVEVGVQFSSLSINLPGFRGTENAVGVGARVTYNLNDYFAVEAEGNIYPTATQSDYTTGGAAQQMQFGVKAGKRWRRLGLFAKARPGFVSFGETLTPLQVESGVVVTFFSLDRERKTHFSADVGGVLEFYPSRRVVVRFDAGDTIIRFGEHAELNPFGPGVARVAAETTHSFQFTGGVGFRFGGGGEDDPGGSAATAASSGRLRRFELGVQFSSLALRLPERSIGFGLPRSFDEGSQAEAGGGARVGFNATDDLAFEAEGNFYPRRRFGIDTAAGGYPAQLQAGVKYGRRFQRFGVFGKARPGFVTFSSVSEVTGFDPLTFEGQTFFIPRIEDRTKTYFSMDLGGVLEFYPKERILTRFDIGDTMIRYPARNGLSDFLSAPLTRLPASLRHNLQLTAGIGFRF